MTDLADRIRTRLVPALLTAFGVTLLAAGLLSLTSGVTADSLVTPAPSVATLAPTASPLITLPPLESGGVPTASPTAPADRVATRIRIAALGIDLAVVKPDADPNAYPPCNVASYLAALGQPGQGRTTYIYAHARTGMFLPLLEASLVQNGKSLLGMVVEVWTSDNQRFLYDISEVRRHVPYDTVLTDSKTEQLWLQTSEGRGRQPKLQVIAEPLSQEAADPADAHPVAKPVVCG